MWADGAGALRSVNVQIKHEMYSRGLCPCVFVDQSTAQFQGRAGKTLGVFSAKLLIALNEGSGLN